MKKIILYLLITFPIVGSTQNVGVGTANPSDALHVVSAVNEDALRVQVGSATKFRVFNNGRTTIGTNNTGGTPVDGLYVHGNTGLGISNPQDKLAVNGDIDIIGTIKANGVSGQEGQILQSNGDGTMSWVNTCLYPNYTDFYYPNNNPYTWVVPAGVTEIVAELWGGGGYGGAGGGGGGGGYLKSKIQVTPGQVLTLYVGYPNTNVNTYIQLPGADYIAYNGSDATANGPGQGGNTSTPTGAPVIRKRGQHGWPTKIHYEQESATTFANVKEYGHGGNGANSIDSGGFGSVKAKNSSNSTILFETSGRYGSSPGGGGGGDDVLSYPGGSGYILLWWK